MKYCIEAKMVGCALAVGTCCLLAAPVVNAEIFRCKDQGKIVYSDRPCVGEVAALNLFVAPAHPAPPMPTTRDPNVPNTRLGMTFKQVLSGEGPPIEKSAEADSRENEVRWTFCRDSVMSDVYFQRGVVTRIERRAPSLPALATMIPAAATRGPNGAQDGSDTPAVESRNVPVNVSGAAPSARYAPR